MYRNIVGFCSHVNCKGCIFKLAPFISLIHACTTGVHRYVCNSCIYKIALLVCILLAVVIFIISLALLVALMLIVESRNSYLCLFESLAQLVVVVLYLESDCLNTNSSNVFKNYLTFASWIFNFLKMYITFWCFIYLLTFIYRHFNLWFTPLTTVFCQYQLNLSFVIIIVSCFYTPYS